MRLELAKPQDEFDYNPIETHQCCTCSVMYRRSEEYDAVNDTRKFVHK